MIAAGSVVEINTKPLTARLTELDTKEDQYLELVGAAGWPKEKIRKKLDAIEVERAEIAGQLSDSGTKLETGREFFLAALDLLRDPQAFYQCGGTSLKRAMNKLIFTTLFVDAENVTAHELADVVRDVVEADGVTRRTFYRRSGALEPTVTPNASSPPPGGRGCMAGSYRD